MHSTQFFPSANYYIFDFTKNIRYKFFIISVSLTISISAPLLPARDTPLDHLACLPYRFLNLPSVTTSGPGSSYPLFSLQDLQSLFLCTIFSFSFQHIRVSSTLRCALRLASQSSSPLTPGALRGPSSISSDPPLPVSFFPPLQAKYTFSPPKLFFVSSVIV